MKTTTEQHISLIERIKEAKKKHRDIVLIMIASEYSQVMNELVGHYLDSLWLADYFTKLVDRLLDNGEYDKAVNHACGIIYEKNLDPDEVEGLIWQYFYDVIDEPLDWYYALYLARFEIDKFIKDYTADNNIIYKEN